MLYMKKNNQMLPLTGSTLYADTPIGTLQAFTGTTAPQGYLIFDGREVSRTEYADLWKFANDNNQVGAGKFYGDGNGSTTFTLADLRETSLKGIGLTSRTVGAHIDADGLELGEFVDDRDQKVTGQFSYGAETNVSYGIGPSGALGAFAPSNNNGYYSKYSVSSIANRGPDANIIFDNSRVIRADDTTEVKAVGVNWIVKAKHVALPIDIMDGISEEYATKDYVDAQIKPHKFTLWWGNVTANQYYIKTIASVTNNAITTQDECYGISCLATGGSLGYDSQETITVTGQNTIQYLCRLTQNQVSSKVVIWY